MAHAVKNRSIDIKQHKTALHNASTTYFYSHGKPVWMEKNYVEFSSSAYINNVIAHRAINMIAHAAASVPLKLYQIIEGKRHLITQHPLLQLLKQPNPMQSGKELLEAIYIYRQISGNAYVLTVNKQIACTSSQCFGGKHGNDPNNSIYENDTTASGLIKAPPERYKKSFNNSIDDDAPAYELYCLRPDRVQVIAGHDFIPLGYRYAVNSHSIDYHVDQKTGISPILHIKNFHPLSDWYGLSSIEAASYSIDQHNQASVWNQSLLQSGGRPSGAIIVKNADGRPASLTDEQFQRLKQRIDEIISGPMNAGRPLLLEGGLEWKEMSLSPKDMDYIESKNNSAREIALAFGVPPQLLGIPGDNTYSNLAEARIALWEQTVLPMVESTLDYFNRWLVSRFSNDLELQHDVDGINALSHRVNSLWERMEKSTFVTTDEKRAAVGLSPL